jgi:hypothetical protein
MSPEVALLAHSLIRRNVRSPPEADISATVQNEAGQILLAVASSGRVAARAAGQREPDRAQIVIGKENYFLSAEGFLMPAKKDQPPPDLRYFKQTQR